MNTVSKRILYFLMFILSFAAVGLSAQSTIQQQPQCLSIHVRLNGKPIDGPQIITLKTQQNEGTVFLEGGCFRVPQTLLIGKAVDVSFTLPGNKIYLVAISPSLLTSPWDIDLADKKFDREINLPKHARISEACAIVFHGGEPENALSQTRCRTPIKKN